MSFFTSARASTSSLRVALAMLVLCFEEVQLCTAASFCKEEDTGQCPNDVHESFADPGTALLQSRRHTERGHAAEKAEHKRRASAPCDCQAQGFHWKRASPRKPRCLFIDLGAADGNTFQSFISNGYGPVKDCPSGGEYEAVLVEANPIFNERLMGVERNYTERVRILSSTAAYMCDGTTSFFLDTVDTSTNFWGSSLADNARDVVRSGQQKVQVPLVNVARLIIESALPEDYVIVKMDIEGAEWDIVPCLAQSEEAAKLIDALYIERHPREWSLVGTDAASYESAIIKLNLFGINTPVYDSATL